MNLVSKKGFEKLFTIILLKLIELSIQLLQDPELILLFVEVFEIPKSKSKIEFNNNDIFLL